MSAYMNGAGGSGSSGSAGGDLSGTYPNPTVAKVNGVTISGTPAAGKALTATSASAADWETVVAPPTWTTYVPTWTGVTSDPSTVARYLQIGKIVFVEFNNVVAATSNATSFTFTLPTNAKGLQTFTFPYGFDNGVVLGFVGATTTDASNVLTLHATSSFNAGWTNSGTKGFATNFMYEAA